MGFVAPSSRGRSLLTLFMAREPDLESNDAFRVLGLDPSPSLDKKEIKRAYKRLALKVRISSPFFLTVVAPIERLTSFTVPSGCIARF